MTVWTDIVDIAKTSGAVAGVAALIGAVIGSVLNGLRYKTQNANEAKQIALAQQKDTREENESRAKALHEVAEAHRELAAIAAARATEAKRESTDLAREIERLRQSLDTTQGARERVGHILLGLAHCALEVNNRAKDLLKMFEDEKARILEGAIERACEALSLDADRLKKALDDDEPDPAYALGALIVLRADIALMTTERFLYASLRNTELPHRLLVTLEQRPELDGPALRQEAEKLAEDARSRLLSALTATSSH
jgi:hypothetical protein